jgi:predicted dehydrogenase
MFTIVGSGFGLYGYLPALVEKFGGPVILPNAYREKLEARPELRPYGDAVRWVANREVALASASAAVVATPPLEQVAVVRRCLGLPELGTLVLEKPVAANPDEASRLLDEIKRAGKRYRIGYSFFHAAWSDRLQLPLVERGGEVAIAWSFTAHHFARGLENWKRDDARGGGVLRFFGMHLVAWLARQGYADVAQSRLEGERAGQSERWSALLRGAGRLDCRVAVDSRAAASRFSIEWRRGGEKQALLDLAEPFELEAAGTPYVDRRVAVLARLLDTLGDDDAPYRELYDAVNRLWRRVEAVAAPS